jgi:hypothetical protein
MAAPKYLPQQVEHRRMIVNDLYLRQGKTFLEISHILATQYDYHVSTVQCFQDVKIMREQWRSSMHSSLDEMRQTELSRLDWIEMEACKAWERSVGVHTQSTMVVTDVTVDATATQQPVKQNGNGNGNGHKMTRQSGKVGKAVTLLETKLLNIKLPAKKTRKTVFSEEMAGAGQFLMIMADVSRQRREMLGLDAPKRLEIKVRHVDNMTDAEQEQVIHEAHTKLTAPPQMTMDAEISQHGPN